MTGPRNGLWTTATMLWIGVMLVASGCSGGPVPPLPVPTAEQPCPQWVLFPPDYNSNADSPYLGCTVAINLRANVANPADLERGRPLRPADGERESRAVEAYQQGKVKPFQSSGSMSPTINAMGTQ
jgi:type IV pilus biogenesis protein CpaD/CtpE